MNRLAIFASGTGTNAKKIIEYFKNSEIAEVVLLVSNKASAPAIKMAENLGIDTLVIDRQTFYHTRNILYELEQQRVNFIVLAGFLWKVPVYLIQSFENKMINIHPALLPKYGGKGMYGRRVHEAVKNADESESGITIHYVNEQYDEGEIIFQARCPVHKDDSAKDIAKKVQKLEHTHYPKVLEAILRRNKIQEQTISKNSE